MSVRGGNRQKQKIEAQFAMWEGNPGLKIMKKSGFVPGMGLGDGNGRNGSKWGVQGRWVSTNSPDALNALTMAVLLSPSPHTDIPPPSFTGSDTSTLCHASAPSFTVYATSAPYLLPSSSRSKKLPSRSWHKFVFPNYPLLARWGKGSPGASSGKRIPCGDT